MCAPTALQVKPYHFDFSCSVRQRWFGQNIIDIFSRVGATAITLPVSLCRRRCCGIATCLCWLLLGLQPPRCNYCCSHTL